eukprot:2821534-Pyramimonas_sp.AAC.1
MVGRQRPRSCFFALTLRSGTDGHPRGWTVTSTRLWCLRQRRQGQLACSRRFCAVAFVAR